MNKIIINKEEDRLTVAAILVKNKYTVQQGKQKRGTGNSYDYFIEYEPTDGRRKRGSDED